MSDSEETVKVENGRSIEFSDGRAVFVGRIPDRDLVAVGFRSRDGDITKLSLSAEGAAALAELIINPSAGVESSPPKTIFDKLRWVYRWEAVIKPADAAPAQS